MFPPRCTQTLSRGKAGVPSLMAPLLRMTMSRAERALHPLGRVIRFSKILPDFAPWVSIIFFSFK